MFLYLLSKIIFNCYKVPSSPFLSAQLEGIKYSLAVVQPLPPPVSKRAFWSHRVSSKSYNGWHVGRHKVTTQWSLTGDKVHSPPLGGAPLPARKQGSNPWLDGNTFCLPGSQAMIRPRARLASPPPPSLGPRQGPERATMCPSL